MSRNFKLLFPVMLILAGMFQSLHTAFQVWFTDPDTASIALVYRGMMEGGWSFLTEFHFPIDNWFLSLILPMTPVFWLFGDGPTVLLVLGVIWFWLTAFFTALIIAKLTNIVRGLWAAAFILWASHSALGLAGYLTFNSAHQSTIAWALLGCYLLISWIEKRSISCLVGALFTFLVTLFSDPWVAPTFLLPLICASVFFLLPQQWPRYKIYFEKSSNSEDEYRLRGKISQRIIWPKEWPLWGGIVGGIGAVSILCKTHFLGLFVLTNLNEANFVRVLPSFELSIKRFFEYLPYLLNIVPRSLKVPLFSDVNLASGDGMFFSAPSFFILIDNVVFLSIICLCVWAYCKYWTSVNQTIKFFLYFCLFSILGILSSCYLISAIYCPLTMRYFANLFYVLAIVVCILPWERISKFIKIPFYMVFGLYFISSFVSNFQAWKITKDWIVYQPDQIEKITAALEGENLKTVYGMTWTSYPHSILWLKKTPVNIYPLWYTQSYLGFTSNIWSSPNWYSNETGKWAFIVLDKDICKPYFNCEEAIENQFGVPSRIKRKDGITLVEYDQDRNVEIEDEHYHAEPIFFPKKLRWNLVSFGKLNFNGWRKLPGFSNLRTSNSAEPEITIPLKNVEGDSVKLSLELSSTSSDNHRYIEVFEGDHFIRSFSVRPGWDDYNVEVPFVKNQRSITLILKLRDDPTSHKRIREPVGLNFQRVRTRAKQQHLFKLSTCSTGDVDMLSEDE